jgi:aryl-alcohol dehydrogenase-like predicted oxidoreductase
MMELRRLRRGIKVSPLGLGTARLAGMGWHEDFAPQISSQTKRDAVR